MPHRSPAAPARFFPGQRWVNIALRCLHLVGVAGMGAHLLGDAGRPAGHAYLLLTLLSGIGLSLLYAWSERTWLLQTTGLGIGLKVLLLALIPLWPSAGGAVFVTVIVLSGVIAHAPARVRHHTPLRPPR